MGRQEGLSNIKYWKYNSLIKMKIRSLVKKIYDIAEEGYVERIDFHIDVHEFIGRINSY